MPNTNETILLRYMVYCFRNVPLYKEAKCCWCTTGVWTQTNTSARSTPTCSQVEPASSQVQPASQASTSTQNRLSRGVSHSNVTIKQHRLLNKLKRNILKTLAVVSLCFIICLGPNQVYYFLINVGLPLNKPFNNPFFDFSVYMMVLNCIINPFIYSAQYSEFKKQVTKLLYRNIQSARSRSVGTSNNVN